MLIKPVLPFAEIMITQACNLSCYGCTNYSDLSHKGYITWDQGRSEIEPWLDRVTIPDFGIMGGEPLINPEVRKWIEGCREILPNSQIRFTTNGILLSKHFDIVRLMSDIGNCVLKITVHENNKEIEDTITQIKSLYKWEEVNEFGIYRFKTKNNFRFQINRPSKFIKTYQNSYSSMMPYNNNPHDAFENCCQQTCPLLFNGKLYKCSTSGLLDKILDRFNRPNQNMWQPYLLSGLSPNCGEYELNEFINNFGKPHSICRQCPTKHEGNIVHLENVSRKNV